MFLDFDGTLAEIVPRPEEASALPGVTEVLEQLTAPFRSVVVVSGRRAAEVGELLGVNVRVFGLHGQEEGSQGLPPTDEVRRILPSVEAIAAEVGAHVERKGPQVAVHYRDAAHPDEVGSKLLARLEPIAREAGLRTTGGRRIVEIAAADAPSKGDVVERIAGEESLRAVLYAGDDVGDLDAFAAVDRLVRRGLAGVKVAVASPEAPPELLAAADATVDGPRELLEFLRLLLT